MFNDARTTLTLVFGEEEYKQNIGWKNSESTKSCMNVKVQREKAIVASIKWQTVLFGGRLGSMERGTEPKSEFFTSQKLTLKKPLTFACHTVSLHVHIF